MIISSLFHRITLAFQLRRAPGDRERSKEVIRVFQSLDQGGYGRCGKRHLDSENAEVQVVVFLDGLDAGVKKTEREELRVTSRFLT